MSLLFVLFYLIFLLIYVSKRLGFESATLFTNSRWERTRFRGRSHSEQKVNDRPVEMNIFKIKVESPQLISVNRVSSGWYDKQKLGKNKFAFIFGGRALKFLKMPLSVANIYPPRSFKFLSGRDTRLI